MLATLYLTLKLTHIFAALALFAVEGVAAIAFRQARSAKDFAALAGALIPLKAIMPMAKVVSPLLFLTGLAMMITTWGFQIAWANLALGIYVAVFGVGMRLDPPWMAALGRAMAGAQGPLTSEAKALLEDRKFYTWTRLRSGLALGLVFLMTVKPGLLVGIVGVVALAAIWLALGAKPQSAPALVQKAAS
ncbi:MAG: hypothetical protein HZB27_00920 [Meiothermus silvanus]|nr:hypothetical protein [Allomeiothermus silvanus]